MPIKYVHIKPKNARITAPIYYIGKILAKLLIIIHIVKILARKIYQLKSEKTRTYGNNTINVIAQYNHK